MPQSKQDALVLFAHGARDPGWAAPLRRIQARLQAAAPGCAVELAFLELMQPDLPQVMRRLAAHNVSRVTIAPVFLAQGGHLKEDLPRLIDGVRAEHPSLAIHVTSALGDSEALTNAIADWALAEHRRAGR